MAMSPNQCVELYCRLEGAVVALAKAGADKAERENGECVLARIIPADLNDYYIPLCQQGMGGDCLDSAVGSRDISERLIMWQFARSLQNSGRMASSVGFKDEYLEQFEDLGIIAEQSNGDKGCLYNRARDGKGNDELVSKLSVKLGKVLGKEDGFSLRKYARGLIEATAFLAERDGRSLVNGAVKRSTTDRPESLEEINGVVKEIMTIHGLGPALARDFLKECGCIWLAKPDIHIIEVFRRIKLIDSSKAAGYYMKEKGARELCDAVLTFAREAANGKGDDSITPYKIDKMVWLLCTGNFYLTKRVGPDGKSLGNVKPLDRHDMVYSLFL